MNEEKAVAIFEQLVLQVMQAGGFKDFQLLDDHRNAVAFLKAKYFIRSAKDDLKNSDNGKLKAAAGKTI